MDKDADAYRTISEVAQALDIPPHVLRFWETKFPQVKPLKRGGGRRYYRRGDVDLLRTIRRLLHDERYTIRGVQQLLKNRKGSAPGAAQPDPEACPAPADGPITSLAGKGTSMSPGIDGRIAALMAEVEACRAILHEALDGCRDPADLPARRTEPLDG